MLKDEFNNFSICKVKPPGGAKLDNADDNVRIVNEHMTDNA